MYYDRLRQRVRVANAKKRQQEEAARLLSRIDIREYMAEVYHPLHENVKAGDYTTYNLPGGRGSAKSSFVSLEIVDGIMHEPGANAIVFRLIASTMRESVYAQIGWAIDTLGVNHLWRSRVSPMCYEYLPTGQQILFRGLDDVAKLKSIKPRHGFFRFIWFEEFAELPGQNFLRNVMQSVQRGGSNFTVFRSFNPPQSRNNWANKFILEPDSKAITLHTDYTMIPPEWLGEAFLYEAERLKELNPTAYEHEYMGNPTSTGGEVFPTIEVREITKDEIDKLDYIFCGLDFGFAADPMAFLRLAYDRKTETIYFLDEIYKRGMSNQATAEEIMERGYHLTGKMSFSISGYHGIEKQTIVCDSAEPKSIQDLQQAGLKAIPCYKKPGCVRYRVRWLQRRRIVIDPKRTPNAYREFTAYSYATDKDGNFLADLPDRENHTIDAAAYALNNVIFHTKGQSA